MDEAKEEWRRWNLARSSPTEGLVELVFPAQSPQVKAELVRLLTAGGVQSGSDLKRKHAGYVHEQMGVPEWACQVLVDKDLLSPGAPKEIDRDGLHVLEMGMTCEGDRIIHDFRGVRLNKQMLQRIHQQMLHTTRMQLAVSDMNSEEASEWSRDRIQAMFGYRAFLRLIAREAPVQTELVDERAFIGSFYFLTRSKTGSSSNSSSSSPVNWSKVVWMLQVEGGGVSYGEAVGRVVEGMRQVFIQQPQREFAFALVCGLEYVHTFKFKAGGYRLGPSCEVIHTRLAPEYVGKSFMSLHRVPGGFFRIIQVFCAPDGVHGFVAQEQGP